MNDLEKANKLVHDKNVSLNDISDVTGIPFESLKNWRYNRSKIENSAWKRIHALAEYYDCVVKPNNFFREFTSIVPRNQIRKLRELRQEYDYFTFDYLTQWRNLDTDELISDADYKRKRIEDALKEFYSYGDYSLAETINRTFLDETDYEKVNRKIAN